MTNLRVFNLNGYNTYSSPLTLKEGDMIESLNVDPFPVGAKTKREGYGTIIGTMPNGSAVDKLFDWHRNDGTTFWLYGVAGGLIYSSAQGTGAWTQTGNGTVSAGVAIGHDVLNDTLFVGDGVGSTRHSTDGTSFTNTTIAPIGKYFTNFGNRLYIGGTASTFFWSSLGDGTNWSSSGTSDSSSIDIPGAGKINAVTKIIDRAVVTKNSGAIFRWDAYNLADLTTHLGPTSAQSIGEIEDYKFWLNRNGFFGFGGEKPQLVSNPIQRLVYNNEQSGIVGTTFDTAPGKTYKYDYLCSIGTVSDDLTGVTISDAISKYNFQLNEWGFYKFNNFPTAWCRYKDNNQVDQLAFGDGSGNVFQYGNGNLNDNGAPIEAKMTFVVHAGAPEALKKWNSASFVFNPGNEAKVQVAAADTFTKAKLKWIDLGDCSDGVAYFRPSEGLRSRLLFVRIYEASRNSKFTFYGFNVSVDLIEK